MKESSHPNTKHACHLRAVNLPTPPIQLPSALIEYQSGIFKLEHYQSFVFCFMTWLRSA